jgi:hypothetical protein
MTPIFQNSRRDTSYDVIRRNVRTDYRARSYNRPNTDGSSLQNYSVCANPDIICENNRRLSTGLQPHESIERKPMVMIDEFDSACDQAMVSDMYLARDIEFAATSKKRMVANQDIGPRFTDPIKFEKYIWFKDAIAADLHLMRPGYLYARNRGIVSDRHALSTPVQPTQGRKYQAISHGAKSKGDFSH